MGALIFLLVVTLIPFTVGFGMGSLSDTVWEQQAIEHKCAEYNPITGEFQWKKEQNK